MKTYYEFTTNTDVPFTSDYLLHGAKKQAEAFLQFMHSQDEEVRLVAVDALKSDKSTLIELNDLAFRCWDNSFECSHGKAHLFTGHQRSIDNKIIIDGEGTLPDTEFDISLFLLFPEFEPYVICEHCQGDGKHDVADFPGSKIVACDCEDVIFTYA